jgi:hypothetical protein
MAEMLEPESPMPAAVTCHLKHLSSFSSIQPSIQPSTQSSTQSSIQSSVIHPALALAPSLPSLLLQLQIIQPKHIPRGGGRIRSKNLDLKTMFTDIELMTTTVQFTGGDDFGGIIEIVTFFAE